MIAQLAISSLALVNGKFLANMEHRLTWAWKVTVKDGVLAHMSLHALLNQRGSHRLHSEASPGRGL